MYKKFIAVGNHAWGRGDTIEQAYTNCKKAGGGNTCAIYNVREEDYVDECNGAIWHDREFPPILVEKRKNGRKALK